MALVFEEFVASGERNSPFVVTQMISGFQRANELTKLARFSQRLRGSSEFSEATRNMVLPPSNYYVGIKLSIDSRNVKWFRFFLSEMEARNVPLQLDFSNNLLQHLRKTNMSTKRVTGTCIDRLFRYMQYRQGDDGIARAVNVHSFNAAMMHHSKGKCTAADVTAVLRYFHLMRSAQIAPSYLTYFAVFRSMSTAPAVSHLVQTYWDIMTNKHNTEDPAMMAKTVAPTAALYNFVLMSFVASDDFDGVLGFAHDMCAADIAPTLVTAHALFGARNVPDETKAVLRELFPTLEHRLQKQRDYKRMRLLERARVQERREEEALRQKQQAADKQEEEEEEDEDEDGEESQQH
jgi:hypothetical protein